MPTPAQQMIEAARANPERGYSEADALAIIDAIKAEERDACAKIARDFAKQLAGQGHGSTDSMSAMADRIADAILKHE